MPAPVSGNRAEPAGGAGWPGASASRIGKGIPAPKAGVGDGISGEGN